MTMNYFDDVTLKLTINDLDILGVLFDKDATATFKAIENKSIIDETGISKFKYFNSLNTLQSMCFIEPTGSKNSKVYITDYGIMALHKTLEGVE